MLDEARRTSFDRKAVQYDAARPSYPEAVVDDVLARTGAHRILEVGAGTGKATALFARRGCTITALEPSRQMAAVLRANTAGLPVTVDETRFEDYTGERHDLVVAAQAFHWVEPAARYVKAAELAPWLALIRNEKAALEPGLRAELDAAYARWMPGSPGSLGVEGERARWLAEIDASALYQQVHVAHYPWRATYTTRAYLDLIDTYSDHAVLPVEQRTALYAAIADAIERRGGELEVPYVTLLFVARVRDAR